MMFSLRVGGLLGFTRFPVRDEESESQRKARSRQARQSRRSTQASPVLIRTFI